MIKKFFTAAVIAGLLIPATSARADNIPTLISVSPSSGDIDGGNLVTLLGENFVDATVIRVAGSVVPDTFVSSTEITITMPARSAGRVSIGAFNGMVGAVLPNSYEYIDTPHPEPTPTPTPEPTPTPTIIDSSPVSSPPPPVAPAPAETPQAANSDESFTTVEQEVLFEQIPVEEEGYPIYDFGNNLFVYTNDLFMNVSLSSLETKRFRFTLQKRIDRSWKTIDVAYRNNDGQLTFYGVPLSDGKYRIVNSSKPIRWFRIV